MADQKINIAIGSTYSGNGMNQALTGVDKLSKTAGKAAGAVGSLGNALGGMGGKAGQAIGAVTKLTSALAMGGPIGLAIAGVTALIGAFNSYKEKQEEAAKAAAEHTKKLKELQAEAEKKAWKEFVDDLARGRVEADSMATALQKVVSLENALASAKQNNVNATQSLAQAELAASTAAKARAESTPEGKALAQAKGGVAMAQMRGDANIANTQTKAQAIGSNINALEQTYDAMVGMHDALEMKIQELEEAWVNSNQGDIETAILDARGDGKYDGLNASQQAGMDAKIKNELMAKDVELQKKITAIRNEEAKIQERIRDEGLKIAALREQQEAADKAILQAKVQAAADLAAAKDAEKQAQDALLTAENEAAGKRLEEEEKILQIKRQQEIAEANELGKIEWQNRLEEAKSRKNEKIKELDDEIEKAKDDYKRAIQRLTDLTNNTPVGGGGGGFGGGGGGFGGGGGGFGGDGGGGSGGGRIKPRTGAAANNEDWGNWGQFTKPEGWDARWGQTHGDPNAPLSKKEQDELNRIDAKAAAGEELKDWEKEKQKELGKRDPERQKQKAEAAADKIKNLMEQKEIQEQKMRDNIQILADILKTRTNSEG